MADATTASAGPAAPPAKGRGKLLMLIIVVCVLLLAGGGGAWWWTSRKAPAKPAAAAAPLPPQYLALDPPFVVNFEADQMVRFLQVSVQLMSRDPHVIELLKGNDPMVRDQLLMLFGNQKYEVLSTREGKEALRKQALESVRGVISSAGGNPEHVEAVYFTSFVMQ
jgi:flagellar FliL protein